jgi:hypothetical protein
LEKIGIYKSAGKVRKVMILVSFEVTLEVKFFYNHILVPSFIFLYSWNCSDLKKNPYLVLSRFLDELRPY